MRHDWTAFSDGPDGNACLLSVSTLENGEPATNASAEELAAEILRLAEEVERLKNDRWREAMAATESVSTPDAEAARDARLEELVAEQESRDASLVAAERARIRRELRPLLPKHSPDPRLADIIEALDRVLPGEG